MPITELTLELFHDIAAYVYKYCGINLTESKKELVNTRLSKLIREHGFSGFQEYYDYLINDKSGDAMSELMNAVSTNLTSFYRESSHFDFMREDLIPNLRSLADKGGKRRLRGWSAGCSMGAEVYTIAMTIRETMPDISSWDVKLLATDIDTNVINTGKKGIYNDKQIEGIPKANLSKYFQASGDKSRYKAKKELLDMVKFNFLNLMNPFPFKNQFDFIFCRNVMIYFTKETQEELVNKFYEFLKPGGYLFIGHSEGLSGIKHNYKYVQPTIYKKK